jgi:hypothetical protein
LVHGVRCTRATLAAWRDRPWPVLQGWLIGALAAAGVLLAAVLTIALITPGSAASAGLGQPPFAVGDLGDVIQILHDNLLVLALHAMACVAGFMAGSSLPLQAPHHTGVVRVIHERGQPVAMAFVVCATGFSGPPPLRTRPRSTPPLRSCSSACSPTRCRSWWRCSFHWRRGSWPAVAASGSAYWPRRSSRLTARLGRGGDGFQLAE